MMQRRRFLQLLGGIGAAAGASTLGLSHLLARADEGSVPKRLILLSHCHGWPYASWRMQPSGTDGSQSWQRSLADLPAETWSQPLAPLFAHRDRLLVLDGLSLATAELDMDGNRHDTGWVQAWTGSWGDFSGSDTRSTAPSLDQLVAAQLARPDRLPSLELSVDASREGGRPIAYAPTGVRLPVTNTPADAWRRLYGLANNPDPLARRQSDLLAFARAEQAALASKLDAVQRERLDAHYGLVEQLQGRIQGLADLSCPDTPEVPGPAETFDERFDAFSDLIAAAFSCDITRVVTLSLGEMPTRDFGWDHFTDDVHKGLAHGIYDDPQKHQAMTDYLTRHAMQVARLVALLESIPDVDGSSLMDNTLIVWGSELGNGWHGYQTYCPVLIGGSWHFRTGRYLHWPHETPIEVLVPRVLSPTGYASTSGKPHQHLLVSTAQAMGLDTQRVGIDHVQGQTGHRVDCTGPLPDLT